MTTRARTTTTQSRAQRRRRRLPSRRRDTAATAAAMATGAVTTSPEPFEGRLAREAARSQDAAQQTFLSAYKALLGGADPRDGEAWLATIAHNECLQRIRARMRQPLPV